MGKLQIDPVSAEKLKEIVGKEVQALTPPDIAFLKARRDYLNEEQGKKFAKVLKNKTPKEEKEEPAEISTKKLKEQAKASGHPDKGVTRSELEDSIQTAEGPERAAQKDKEAFDREREKEQAVEEKKAKEQTAREQKDKKNKDKKNK